MEGGPRLGAATGLATGAWGPPPDAIAKVREGAFNAVHTRGLWDPSCPVSTTTRHMPRGEPWALADHRGCRPLGGNLQRELADKLKAAELGLSFRWATTTWVAGDGVLEVIAKGWP